MVTVSDQQSRLAMPSRVILETSLIKKSDLSTSRPDATFHCAGKSFSCINQAEAKVIELAIDAINQGYSAAVIPHHFIRPDAIFFDMDATVIKEESLVEIADAAGKKKEIEDLTTAAMAGGLDFKESLKARLLLLRGLDRNIVLSVRPTLSNGMIQLASWCHQHQIPIFLVSGGFVDLAGPVAKQLGFKDFRANRFAWDGDRLAGFVDGDIVDGEGKRTAVNHWCQIHNLDPKRCIAVGDGANDRLMMDLCGLSVGFLPKKVLWSFLRMSNHTGDHRLLMDALAPIQRPPY
jgi:phosphoserine phosphatase